MSLKEKIRNAKKVPPKKLTVPEWGVDIYIPRKTVKERSDFEKSLTKLNKRSSDAAMEEVRARMLIYGCRDEHGAPIWDVSDIETISGYDSAPVDYIIDEMRKFCHITEDDIETMAKNAEGTLDGDSSGVSA